MAATFVVDASVGVALVTNTEPQHALANLRYTTLLESGARFVTTPFYVFETGNAIARARPKDLARERYEAARELALSIPLESPGLLRAFDVALDGKLSFYDAAYLALAEQEEGTLWTEDKEILKRFPGRSASTAELTRRPSPSR